MLHLLNKIKIVKCHILFLSMYKGITMYILILGAIKENKAERQIMGREKNFAKHNKLLGL